MTLSRLVSEIPNREDSLHVPLHLPCPYRIGRTLRQSPVQALGPQSKSNSLPSAGFIDFGDSNCELLAHPDHVLMILNSPDEDSLAHMQNVVADHLQRMANSESLEIAWQPAES